MLGLGIFHSLQYPSFDQSIQVTNRNTMVDKFSLGSVDYLVIALSFAVAAAIGVKFRPSGGHQKTTGEFLMAGRNMSKFPVMLSFVVTNVSSIAMLGLPAEMYKYGSQLVIWALANPVGVILSSYIVMPVYFQCGVSSIYEFLEHRFGKLTRSVVSALYIFQMVIFMSVCLYGPALALNAVTYLSIEMSIVVMGFICMFYCSMGGLKAVLWTDVFQAFLMLMCILTVYVVGFIDSKGIVNIYKRAKYGNRLNVFDLSFDFTTRYTFWNVLARGLSGGFGNYGINQTEVQRMLSLGSYERARSTILWSLIPIAALFLCCMGLGLILYSVFYLCDPITAQAETGVSRYDQLLPYYIVTRLNSIPGLTGLCVAGIFGGALSTISSALHSVSTVTVIDVIQSIWTPNRQKEAKMLFVSKGLVILFGCICIGLSFAFVLTESIVQVAMVFLSITEGPRIAVFLIGVLTTMGTDKSILFGFLVGVAISGWAGFEILFHGYPQLPLPFSSHGCAKFENISYGYSAAFKDTKALNYSITMPNATTHFPIGLISRNQNWLSNLSYMWLPTCGFCITFCAILIFIFIFERNKQAVHPDMKCLSPITRLWMSQPTSRKGYSSNYVPTELEELSPERIQL